MAKTGVMNVKNIRPLNDDERRAIEAALREYIANHSEKKACTNRVPRGITVEDWEYIVVALRFIADMTRNPESRKRSIELLGKLGKGI